MPELKLYNTLTRQKEVFQPEDPDDVRMYVCGPRFCRPKGGTGFRISGKTKVMREARYDGA